mmetsp:Transcript_25110/g.59655  ORF Transcript_25110/g.59655 Transcript_25110/m.59655 type:complete len:329 (+) Transcript_25110:874-1860(+)
MTMINSNHKNGNLNGSSTHDSREPVKHHQKPRRARSLSPENDTKHKHNHHQGGLAEFVASTTRNIFHVGAGKQQRNAPARSTSESSSCESVRSNRSTSTDCTSTTCMSSTSFSTSCSSSSDCAHLLLEKRVQFAGKVCVRKIPTLAHYTEQEKIDAWFTEEEYAKISNDCVKQIKRLDSGETFRGKKYCARGIEHHTRIGSIVRMKNRSVSIDAVLDEQDRQHAESEQYNDRKLSNVYRRCTSSSQLWAQTIGLRDQKEAEAATFDDEDEEWHDDDSCEPVSRASGTMSRHGNQTMSPKKPHHILLSSSINGFGEVGPCRKGYNALSA